MNRKTLRTLLLAEPRASGRTHLMIEGIKNARTPVFVVVHNHEFGKEIKTRAGNNPNIIISTPQTFLRDTIGLNYPVVIDHFTMQYLLEQLEEENQKLKDKLCTLQQKEPVE